MISSSNDNTRYDYAVYNNDSLCFVELKYMQATSFSKYRKKAEKQLKSTVFQFEDEGKIEDKRLEPHVFSDYISEKDNNFNPITQQPKNINQRTYFEFELNTTLLYSTKKEFN